MTEWDYHTFGDGFGETGFTAIVGHHGSSEVSSEDQLLAIKKAQNFYDRILDGYGDDSIGELGGAHLALENVSMIAAKVIEDCRIGGSPLEKSTRYIYFDQKVNGEYLYYREPVLMTSAFRDLYINTCNDLFDTYSRLIPPLTERIREAFPKDPESSKVAYNAALRAKVLDCLRGLLPAGTLTNMGLYGNGRFFEMMVHKLRTHNLVEIQDLGRDSFEELNKVIPSFVRRSGADHRHHKGFAEYFEALNAEQKLLAEQHVDQPERNMDPGVRLVRFDKDAESKVAGAILYPFSDRGLFELQEHCAGLPEEQLAQILDSACSHRENRRHKGPRALEHAYYTFEIVADFGIYRDLQRHRVLTQDRQLLTCDYSYYLPPELRDTELEQDYVEAMDKAKEAFDMMRKEFPEEAQYVVPMAYNIRWYFHVNLRALQWLCELRSAAAGHPAYRYIAQELAKQVSEVHPEFERFFKFVDFEGHELGRLGQEQRTASKLEAAKHSS